MWNPLPTALIGLMYSLVAMGIVLIYKSSSVPNLAQGSMTMLAAYVVLAFANNAGAPIWAAMSLAIITMFIIGWPSNGSRCGASPAAPSS